MDCKGAFIVEAHNTQPDKTPQGPESWYAQQQGQSGLVQLYPKLGDHQDIQGLSHSTQDTTPQFPPVCEAIVDIIAIHGLGTTQASYIWKQSDEAEPRGINWLQDQGMLPAVVPRSRIFTYEWNSGFDQNAAIKNMAEHADELLRHLYKLRTAHDSRGLDGETRPIIFIAACFGGLLLLKALSQAMAEESQSPFPYSLIPLQTAGAIFMGTPFSGSHTALYETCNLRMRIGAHLGKDTSQYLVSLLKSDSSELKEIVENFKQLSSRSEFDFPVCCVYETRTADYSTSMGQVRNNLKKKSRERRGWKFGKNDRVLDKLWTEIQGTMDSDLSMMVVNRQSATLPGREKLALDVKHGNLIRFPGADDPSFGKIADLVTKMAEKACEVLRRK
ncbi:unnamed protein product [Clonostachys chloroleuca]|uniref:Uncharacterized protein n=1 Tax=Clonostachys chloroleuca TaxID=1926264 RepID=A0AA35Q3U5_9HYPO|nr:unnamed protein product [Clonostachys chloroleuca]